LNMDRLNSFLAPLEKQEPALIFLARSVNAKRLGDGDMGSVNGGLISEKG
jgi:hypothetical protein